MIDITQTLTVRPLNKEKEDLQGEAPARTLEANPTNLNHPQSPSFLSGTSKRHKKTKILMKYYIELSMHQPLS